MNAATPVSSWKHWLSAVDRNDVAGVAGAALVTAGLWQIYPPLAQIALGSGLVLLAVRGAKGG